MTASPRRLRGAALGLLCSLLMASVVAFAPSPASARQTASLTVSPDSYYAGQGVRFAGRMPHSGEQRIWLEFNMNRPGDVWTPLAGSEHATDSAGRFSFRHPAPGMNNISVRVASAGGATPGRLFHAVPEDVTLGVAPQDGSWPVRTDPARYEPFVAYPAVVGEPATITVDTSPSGGPILAGRTVTLQRRVDATTWDTLATGKVGVRGKTRFTRTFTDRGPVVLRALLADWTENGSDVGWRDSYPTYVYVLDRDGGGAQPPVYTDGSSTPSPPNGPLPEGANASARYGWGETIYDYAWEWGESLDDLPFKGKRKQGHWVEGSTGSGRASRYNGGLFLQSRYGEVLPRDAGPGDHGTTTATLAGNAQSTGRWEIKLRAWEIREAGDPYRVRVELIPEDPAQRACGARTITLADFRPAGHTIRYGVTTPTNHRKWSGVRRGVTISQAFHAYAAEVTSGHITWFLDGNPVGRVDAPAALPGVPLTVRLSLVGRGHHEMRHAYAGADWIRAWDMTGPQPVSGGTRLRSGTHHISCPG